MAGKRKTRAARTWSTHMLRLIKYIDVLRLQWKLNHPASFKLDFRAAAVTVTTCASSTPATVVITTAIAGVYELRAVAVGTTTITIAFNLLGKFGTFALDMEVINP